MEFGCKYFFFIIFEEEFIYFNRYLMVPPDNDSVKRYMPVPLLFVGTVSLKDSKFIWLYLMYQVTEVYV